MPHPPPRTVQVHAHRGGRALRPENTLPAFLYAIEIGADVLELDLAVTRDNILVASHSPFLTPPDTPAHANERRCLGPALPPGTPIHSLTLAQLRHYDCGALTLPNFPRQLAIPSTPIPTFDEILALAPLGPFDFTVETKIFPPHPDLTPTPEVFVQLIDAAVRRHNLTHRVILQSFDFRTLHAMRALNPAVRLSALFDADPNDTLLAPTDPNRSFSQIARITNAEILSPDYTLVTPETVAEAHRLHRQVLPWTPNNPNAWQTLVSAGVDALITDDPAACLTWLRSQTPSLHP